MDLISVLDIAGQKNNLKLIKEDTEKLYTSVAKLYAKQKQIRYSLNDSSQTFNKDLLLKELKQILDARTIERTKYYLKRLVKSLSVQKNGKINDLNLNRWKEYDELITDSLWIFDKRDNSGAHRSGYWGNFIPQIPNQLLKRFTKKGDWVLDPFLGSGTTLIECKRLGRNAVGIELNQDVVKIAESNIGKEKNPHDVSSKVILSDSTATEFKKEIKKFYSGSFQFLIMHPPYWDIIKFSNKRGDLSNTKSIQDFLSQFGKAADNTFPLLDKGRYCAVVIGDKYSAGTWIPLGFYVMQEMLKRGFKLKSTIIKNFDYTTAKRNQHKLWRYRALAGGFYIFKHEYIFLFQK